MLTMTATFVLSRHGSDPPSLVLACVLCLLHTARGAKASANGRFRGTWILCGHRHLHLWSHRRIRISRVAVEIDHRLRGAQEICLELIVARILLPARCVDFHRG